VIETKKHNKHPTKSAAMSFDCEVVVSAPATINE